MYNLILERPFKTTHQYIGEQTFDRMNGATHSWVMFFDEQKKAWGLDWFGKKQKKKDEAFKDKQALISFFFSLSHFLSTVSDYTCKTYD